ncbi:immunoglobulin superfamily containing leucine-rich repeat protein 2-like [Ascaphus truei]|uniref:immunoglobulin superfamily containing leucine-rich repeat protein 2-like n=1 Tax=Ascaphus truei TaxID=8439 RepID=UPI003F5A36E6
MATVLLFLGTVWYLCLAPGSPCPANCRCVTRSTRPSADCSYRELQYVPTNLPFNITQLSLSVNDICALNATSFSNVLGVTSLWLAYNKIATIDTGTFRDLVLLQSLDLSHNQLSDFPWSDLSTLPALQLLNLNHNQLVTLPRGAFNWSQSLRSLQLSNNHFSVLADGTFDPLTSLSHFQLHSNPFHCSCPLVWLKHWLEKARATINWRKDVTCSSPEELSGTSLERVPDLECTKPSEVQGGGPMAEKVWLLCHEAGVHHLTVHTETKGSTGYRELEVAIKVFTNRSIAVTPIKHDMVYLCRVTNNTDATPGEVTVSLDGSERSGWLRKQGEKLMLVLVSERSRAERNKGSSALAVPVLWWLGLLMVWWLALLGH